MLKENQAKKLAADHVDWYAGLLREQSAAYMLLINGMHQQWLKISESLMRANFEHGYKHGSEDAQDEKEPLGTSSVSIQRTARRTR